MIVEERLVTYINSLDSGNTPLLEEIRRCVLGEDDSQRVLKMLQDADAIIMGAPCYWGNIPGQMKLLFDRLVYGMMRDTPRFPEPLMKGKKCILLSTCTTPWPWNILFKQDIRYTRQRDKVRIRVF